LKQKELVSPVWLYFTVILQYTGSQFKYLLYHGVNKFKRGLKMVKTWKPVTAGILSILSGVFGILISLVIFSRADDVVRNGRHVRLESLAIILLITALISIAGGIFALLRKAWGFALAGAICAIISPGWILGVLATVFVSIAKNEFDAKPLNTP
jgi:uncharacterized membrane protein